MKTSDRVLPADLTIYATGEWHGRCLAWLDAATAQDADVVLDGAAVEEIDGAGLQLLVSLANALARHGRQLQLAEPSSVLTRACEALGAGFLLAPELAA